MMDQDIEQGPEQDQEYDQTQRLQCPAVRAVAGVGQLSWKPVAPVIKSTDY